MKLIGPLTSKDIKVKGAPVDKVRGSVGVGGMQEMVMRVNMTPKDI